MYNTKLKRKETDKVKDIEQNIKNIDDMICGDSGMTENEIDRLKQNREALEKELEAHWRKRCRGAQIRS